MFNETNLNFIDKILFRLTDYFLPYSVQYFSDIQDGNKLTNI